MRHSRFYVLLAVLALAASVAVPPGRAAAAGPISFTILHTNDFHGQLEASGSNPGMARVATVVNGVRTAKGADNVLLVDAGDEMQGSLLSNLQKGAPTTAAFKAMGYSVATFGNHEFDWGQTVLADRVAQAADTTGGANPYAFVSANIVTNDTGNCDTAGWTLPSFVSAPYVVETVAGVKVGFIGVTTQETPTITIATATEGLCFKDPAVSIEHYYADLKAASDVIVVLSHLGFNDGGYGYGIPVYGDKTLATKLNADGKPVALIIGGHSHTNMLGLTPPGAVTVGSTVIGQAYYSGRQVGEADVTFDPATKTASLAWKANVVVPPGAKDASGNPIPETPEDPAMKALVATYASDPGYQALISQPIGYSAVDLLRDYNGDNMMGDFVDDAVYNYLNTDSDPSNDVDFFLNNAGGIRADWCWNGSDWVNTGCVSGTHAPGLLTYGDMFTVLPFGNQTIVGSMTGAQILQVLNQSATLAKGAIQPAGLRYEFYAYRDANPGPQPYAWGAYDACVVNRTSGDCDPLEMDRTYRVGTNEFLAPAGGDNYAAFKYMTDISYYGDMLNAVDAYVAAHHGTAATAYRGPTGDGTLDGRIARDGTDAPNSGSIVPITILHNNDSHGNLAKGQYVGYTQLASLIKQEEAHNPGRTLLLNAGDQIQGDAMMAYFKTSYSGKASDGTPLPADLQTNPMMAVMNALGYDAMTLGNHEFNFGGAIFQGVLGQADFPILGANVADDGSYGLAGADGGAGVQPYIEKNLGGIKVAILGITNHRVPNYELPSNIQGLTFSNPITAGEKYAPELQTKDDVVIALTHIGFTEDPKSVEVDQNVDTNFAAEVPGVDAIIGGHSHTSPVTAYGDYKFLPTIVGGPDNAPVIINQAYRYNNYLGEVVMGVRLRTTAAADQVAQMLSLGQIDNAGLANSLTKKLSAAQAALDKGQTQAALNQLDAFVGEVTAQRGKHIRTGAADQLLSAAQLMIADKGGHEVAARAGQYLAVTKDTPEDPAIKAIVDPYVAALSTYQNAVIGQTAVPIDTTNAYVDETNAANLQADAAVFELQKNGVSDVDVHLSGAMTQSNPKVLFPGATAGSPASVKVSDMFTLMPYENSLVVLKMNGPQLKAVLERAYRNYYYYKYVPSHGGYSYYTTCMLDTSSVGKITYNEKSSGGTPPLPDGNNVVSLTIDGKAVDFGDAATYYNVSTVNYLAAGSCNFNDGGVSLWPLDQIVHDTQYYVRDAVVDYIKAQTAPIAPAIEGRVVFQPTP